ncbi:MAG: rhomboid family intramembrane serine protease [Bacteroidota bacterium]|jgi:membrane associated rhomboid family serine protease|nr:MAG: rhomboid family intramembrane serine protease [Bacteroidota bacterium]
MLDDFKQAFNRYNNAHVQIIIINVVIFLALAVLRVFSAILQADGFFEFIHHNIAIPALFSDFVEKPWTIITYAFVHDLSGILHIFFNMLILYWFGRLFVEYLGSDKLIAVYVLGFLAGGIMFLLAYNLIPYYKLNIPAGGMVGASAAVNAVVVACATLLPNYTFFLLLLGPIRIKYIAAFFVVVSFIGTVGTNEGGNLAHLGGALIGYLYIKQLKAGRNIGGWVTFVLDWFRRMLKPETRVKVTYRGQRKKTKEGRKPATDRVSQDEIDAILDKISEGGYESLTREEKEKLFNASRK